MLPVVAGHGVFGMLFVHDVVGEDSTCFDGGVWFEFRPGFVVSLLDESSRIGFLMVGVGFLYELSLVLRRLLLDGADVLWPGVADGSSSI
ncbi:hypothetical protein Nepgr_022834 [Nepenthes gracilis]|uniref:Uncharacterized protein n=1 Tax=Nepenthes gracilis TaxID=150966 RepID=A0AAD3T1L9_NEPGR|nr:hypothetical protein Nepgr_022834 [Nepenthes gracilis]